MRVAENIRRKNDRRAVPDGQESDADAVNGFCVLDSWQVHGHRYSSTQWRIRNRNRETGFMRHLFE
jgi:hypothetical protein